MPLKICNGNERRCLSPCLVRRLLKAKTYRDLQSSIFVFILIARTRKGKQKSQTASGYGYRFYPEKKFIWIVVASMVGGLEVF